MIATYTTIDILTDLEEQHIRRVSKLMILVDELKKSRLHFVKALQKNDDTTKAPTYFNFVKERIVFIIQLQNQINKYAKRIQEFARKFHFESDDLESNGNLEDSKSYVTLILSHEKSLVVTYQSIINDLPLSSDLELLLCKQLNSLENCCDMLHD